MTNKIYERNNNDIKAFVEILYNANDIRIENAPDGSYYKTKKDGTRYSSLYYISHIDGNKYYISSKLKDFLIEKEIILQDN